ncbi:ATP-dependent DNA helicase [Hortaea werneckii]|nr:ATP-dependent DNA helicase [Hortaea werneckii]
MGRYNLAPQRVNQKATQLLSSKRLPNPPPWYHISSTVPPSSRLDRPPLQRSQIPGHKPPGGKKKSKLFKPLQLKYEEDRLRWEYFNDHPWELARPRVVLENDGRDAERWDWSVPLDHALNRPRAGEVNALGRRTDAEWDHVRRTQAGRPINGEAVVQRQSYLMSHGGLTTALAYDTARKEFYRYRHYLETSTRVAREEALAVGAFFGPGPVEIGMHLENQAYEGWKAWAEKEVAAMKQMAGAAYTGTENQEAAISSPEVPEQEDLQEVSQLSRRLDQNVDIEFTLRKVFGKTGFRPVQREVIVASLEGRDVFLQAATSFGKSICFQLPAVVDVGITIVISPLLALMNNQLAAMEKAGIKVATINSTTPLGIKNDILGDLKSGHPRTRLLYVTPEYCTLDYFRKCLRTVHEQRELARIAIDEAHCISEWGHDFRPSFKQLDFFKREFPDVPMICCTATATQRVRDDIMNTLALDRLRLRCFTMTTHRPNLHYEVRFKSDEEDHYPDFLNWLRACHQRRAAHPHRTQELTARNERIDNVSGIIYVLYRRDTEALSARLRSDGIGAKPYHAGLSIDAKSDHLSGWVQNRPGYDVIVATTAFGMGIDKENVRFVVHWQLPKSFEGFYQEAGRAGRDGKAAVCMLYYSREDRDRAAFLMGRETANTANATTTSGAQGKSKREAQVNRARSLQSLIAFCEDTGKCRHRAIAEYFGDTTLPKCEWACDWHKDAVGLERRKGKGLSSEEWCATQREVGYAVDEYD